MIERRKTGTYISCSYTRDSENLLEEWVRRQGQDIPKPLDKQNYHTTIMYSRKELNLVPYPSFANKYKVRTKGYRLFPSDKGAQFRSLALLLEAPELSNYHGALIKAGGTHDFPDYTPHITLSYYANENTKLWELNIPDFELEIYGIMICPLDLNWNENE